MCFEAYSLLCAIWDLKGSQPYRLFPALVEEDGRTYVKLPLLTPSLPSFFASQTACDFLHLSVRTVSFRGVQLVHYDKTVLSSQATLDLSLPA